MAIKYKRDESRLVAKTKVPVEYCPGKFFRVCLWADQRAMCAASAEPVNPDALPSAFCCHSSYVLRRTDAGYVETRAANLLGEMHFTAGKWDEEVVAHECFHATTNICKRLLIRPEMHIEEEEWAAYIHGRLVRETYRWLWRTDTSKKRWYDRLRDWMRDWTLCIQSMFRC